MDPQIVIFEDHTAAGFLPLSASVPVYELRCGLHNLRERLAYVAKREPTVLPRFHLAALAGRCGHDVGVATRDLGAALLISSRVAGDWQILSSLLAAARAGTGWSLHDADGPLAAGLDAKATEDFLATWRHWDGEAAARSCWRDPMVDVPRFEPMLPAATPALPEGSVLPIAWRRLWDLVSSLATALIADASACREMGLAAQQPWGVVGVGGQSPAWSLPSVVAPASWPGVQIVQPDQVLAAEGVRVAPGVVIDASKGPVVLGRLVAVMPHSYLEGPLYLGAGTVVKPGTRLAECSIGAGCKVAGEIGESVFLDLVNKQHDGFIGHAYLGSWVNLGAETTCSDLKNNYGRIRVDTGAGEEDTGLRFLGLMIGEHSKTAIGTLFNTGTAVGFASNVFAAGFPPKTLPGFTWGDGRGGVVQDVERALATATVAMSRRGCVLTEEHAALFRFLGQR